ncbi:MAG TPA: VWA domain-containing protein [Bryobacteraceae bacterium]|jgi:VWFA-related protein|nr:VWA domain-containing protein [Bryobacteraceae bacterium]
MVGRAAVWCSFFITIAWAQASSGPELPPQTVFRSDSRLVVLNVSILDPEGKIVSGVRQSDVTVYEDGVKQNIKIFRQEDVPVSLGLIIDNSASMANKRDRVNSAALAMVKASNPRDEVFLIHFDTAAFLSTDFTSNIQQLEKGLQGADAKGETAMRDALLLSMEHLRHSGKKDKKVLLVVTDGEDNSSIETLSHLVQAAHQSDVIIYGIGLLGTEKPESAERAKKEITVLTQNTGGRSWFPNDVADILRITPEIAHEVRNQYIVGYTSTNEAADGSFRKVRVDVHQPDVTVRTRSGYYAPRQ